MFYNEKVHFPIRADIYLRKEDSDKNNPYFRLRDIFINQIHYAIKQGLPIKIIMADAGLQAEYVCQEIKSLGLKYVIGARVTTKISIKKRKRVTIKEYLDTISKKDFSRFKINDEKFYIHTVEIYNRKIGKEKLIITYKKNDDCIKIYTSNILDKSDEVLMHILLKRWNIEVLHRDEKQHLGLEDYQVRKFGGIQRVVLVVLVAYVVLILNASRQWFLHCFYRKLQTIGESCRYFRLIATKGKRWIRKKAKEVKELARTMNRFVFVKNAKV
jgi:SRSO17 transposase